jgi:hypothetical protein
MKTTYIVLSLSGVVILCAILALSTPWQTEGLLITDVDVAVDNSISLYLAKVKSCSSDGFCTSVSWDDYSTSSFSSATSSTSPELDNCINSARAGESMVILSLVFVGLAVFCHLWGEKLGLNSASTYYCLLWFTMSSCVFSLIAIILWPAGSCFQKSLFSNVDFGNSISSYKHLGL